MPQVDDVLREALLVLSGQLDAGARGTEARETAESLEELRRFVADRVADLLDRNPSLLLSILYRVDVAERDVKQVLRETEPARIPLELADLLIERQLQKIMIRRSYSAGKQD